MMQYNDNVSVSQGIAGFRAVDQVAWQCGFDDDKRNDTSTGKYRHGGPDRAIFPVYRGIKFHDVDAFGLICDIIAVQRGRLPSPTFSCRLQDGQPNIFPIPRIIHSLEASKSP